MERKITKHLVVMGIFGAVLGVLLTALAFQNRIEQRIEETLSTNAEIMCMVYNTTLIRSTMTRYLPEGYYLQVIDLEGNLLYDSRSNAAITSDDAYQDYLNTKNNHDPQAVLARKEVADALRYGKGISHNTSMALWDEYRYATQLSGRQLLILYTTESNLFSWYLRMLPILLLVFFILLAVSYLLSTLVTRRLVAPINRLSQRINDETLDFDGKSVYPELVPFVSEIYMQRQRNRQRISQLAEEKNKLTTIMKDMSEGIVVIDRSRRILMANDMAQTLFNFHPDLDSEPYYLTSNAALKTCVDAAMRGHSKTIVTEIAGRQLQVTADPIFSDKKQTAIVCSVRDITEQMAVDKMKQEFSANVSHELKTPLASISGYAEMIETGIAQPEDVQRFAHIIHRESGRLLSLINDIIQLSRLDESEGIETEPVDMLQLAEETCDVLTLNATNREVTLQVCGTGFTVTGARDLLQELVYNLVDNAIKYNRPGGRVTVSAAERVLRVSDTGIGIPDSAKPHLFERFYRVEKSRSKEMGGTGLGLAIVKHIADLHKARIFVEDVPGGGTCFAVVFPAP